MNTGTTSILEALAASNEATHVGCPACGRHITEIHDGKCSLCDTKLRLQVHLQRGIQLRMLLMGFPMGYSFLSALLLGVPVAFSTSLPPEVLVAELAGFLSGVGLFIFWCLRHRYIRTGLGIQYAWLAGIWVGYSVLAFIVFVAM